MRTLCWFPLCIVAVLLCAGLAEAQSETRLVPNPSAGRSGSLTYRTRTSAPRIAPSPVPAAPADEEFVVDDESCSGCMGRGCGWCLPHPPRIWGSAEILFWWRKGMNLPPLVTNNDSPPVVLFGDERVGEGARPGGRLNLGYWFNACETCGVGGSFYSLGEQSVHFDSRATGEVFILRPFFVNGRETVLAVNAPGIATGNVIANTTSDVLGGDAHFRTLLWRNCSVRVDFLAGYQTSRIDEDLTIRHVITDNAGVVFDATDRFATKNEFHGGQLGLLTQYRDPCWTVDVLAKVGLGNMEETIAVSGSDISGDGPGSSLLARSSNAGIRSRDEFAVVPEVGVKAALHVSNCIDLTAGYSFIYWSEVVQPGDQIDLNRPPQPLFSSTDFFIHGVNFGLNFRY